MLARITISSTLLFRQRHLPQPYLLLQAQRQISARSPLRDICFSHEERHPLNGLNFLNQDTQGGTFAPLWRFDSIYQLRTRARFRRRQSSLKSPIRLHYLRLVGVEMNEEGGARPPRRRHCPCHGGGV